MEAPILVVIAAVITGIIAALLIWGLVDRRKVKRQVLAVQCTECGAQPGDPCRDDYGRSMGAPIITWQTLGDGFHRSRLYTQGHIYVDDRNLKEHVLAVQCMDCGAKPGDPCKDDYGRISGFHESRVMVKSLDEEQKAYLHFMPCPECEAEPGEPCTGPSGATTGVFHSERVKAGELCALVATKNFFCGACDASLGQPCTPLPADKHSPIPIIHGERIVVARDLMGMVTLDYDALPVDDVDPTRRDPTRLLGVRLRAISHHHCLTCEAAPGQPCTPLSTDEEYTPDPDVFMDANRSATAKDFTGTIHGPRLDSALRELHSRQRR